MSGEIKSLLKSLNHVFGIGTFVSQKQGDVSIVIHKLYILRNCFFFRCMMRMEVKKKLTPSLEFSGTFSSGCLGFFCARWMNDIGFWNGNFSPSSKYLSHNICSFSQIYAKALLSQFPWCSRDLIFLAILLNVFAGIYSYTTQFHKRWFLSSFTFSPFRTELRGLIPAIVTATQWQIENGFEIP